MQRLCSPCPYSCPCCRLVGGTTRKAYELRCEQQPCEGTTLHAAAAQGDAEEVLQLLRSSDVNACDALGSTALHFAAASGSPDVLWRLLEAGADVSQPNCLGLAPLHAFCCGLQGGCCTSSEEVLRLLLDAGADPTAATVPSSAELEVLAGDTPLTLLAQHAFPGAGAAPLVASLLAAGADPLLPSLGLLTSALEFACAAGGGWGLDLSKPRCIAHGTALGEKPRSTSALATILCCCLASPQASKLVARQPALTMR
jgi:ankyrin repeat protein